MRLYVIFGWISLFSCSAFSAPRILNWTTSEISEASALEAVGYGVRQYIEENNSCQLMNVWGYEAFNHLRDVNGNPLIVVSSIAEVGGSLCDLEKYQDCSSVFVKQNGSWKYQVTTCESEESVE